MVIADESLVSFSLQAWAERWETSKLRHKVLLVTQATETLSKLTIRAQTVLYVM